MRINVKLMGGRYPVYKRTGDACADCYVRPDFKCEIKPFETTKIPLGFAMEIPEGMEAVIRPRSSTSLKGVLVHTGTIDSGYRGELNCIVTNLNSSSFCVDGSVEEGLRLCQLKIQEAEQFDFKNVSELSASDRGDRGFGSTGN